MAEGAKKRSARPLVMLVLVALGVGGWQLYKRWQLRQPLEIGGTVEIRTVQVASRMGGRVREVLVTEGEHVHAGQALIRLDDAELVARVAEARGAVTLARAQLERTVNGPRVAEIAAYRARLQSAQAQLTELSRGARREDVERARAQLAASESQLRSAQLVLNRAQTLMASGSIAQSEFDNASAQVQTATANRDAARSAVEVLTHGTRTEDVAQARGRAAEAAAQLENAQAGSRDEDVRASRAQLEQAEARLALAEINVREATISAPRECTIEALDLRPGDIVGPNQPAATLVEEDQMYLRAYIPETQLGLVRVGATVDFTVDTFGDRRFHATVQHVNEVGEYNPRNVQTADERANQVFLVRLGITEDRQFLRAGMAATVHLPRRQP